MNKHNMSFKNFLLRLSSRQGVLFHIAGISAMIWFVIRVLPRPDRIRYPCQQMGVSIAFGYIVFWSFLWSAVFHGLGLWVKRVKSRTVAYAPVILVCFVLIFSVSSGVYATLYIDENEERPALWDPIPKDPIGTPLGYKPGRVVWCWDADATEESLDGYWWENQNNDQDVIDQMFSLGIKRLAEVDDDYDAWDLLFKYFNEEHGYGQVGYQSGETIAIKINLNNCGSYTGEDNDRDASPQVVKSLLRHLVNIVNVDQDDIFIYDASRSFGNWLYNRIYYEDYPADPLVPEFPDVHYVDAYGSASGREKVVASSDRVYFADGSCEYRTLPSCVADADYLINMPLLKRHPIYTGVTLAGKNFFGTWMEAVSAVHDYHYSSFTLGNPAPQTDLFAHESIGGNTVLTIGDGLFATPNDHRVIGKFEMYPFDNDWTNSLFFSQDQVAIDSVMYDFLLAEGTNPVEGSQNYLHQSADPPSFVYDPENDGKYLSDSLGVHEHWDTDEDIFSCMRYSGPSNDGIDYHFVDGEVFIVDTGGPYFGLIDEPVQFNGIVSGGYSPFSWEWDFGDGGFSYEQNPSHVYSNPGNYTVTLNVTDLTCETSTGSSWCLVQESNNGPNEPEIDGPPGGKTGQELTFVFNALDPDGDDVRFVIDWGDGNSDTTDFVPSGTDKSVSHVWSVAGNYVISVYAEDIFGNMGPSTSFTIMIPRDKVVNNPFLIWFQNHPIVFPLLQKLIQLGFLL